jgi:hypothetical protein
MKKVLKIIGLLVLILIVAVVVFMVQFEPKKLTDYGVFDDLKSQSLGYFKDYGAKERPITKEFETFVLNVSFPFNKAFGSDRVGLPLKSFQNDKMAVATISQFQIPFKADYYRDFTLNIRPNYGIKAPVFHIDFMKPAPGNSGLCIVDFFNVDKERIDYEAFFGTEAAAVKKALSMVEPYQRSPEAGRGEITKYLDPYKSPYRFELVEPGAEDDTARKQYYETVGQAISLLLPVYLKCLHRAEMDAQFVKPNEEKMKELVRAIYDNDFAVATGKKIFKDSFKRYWLDGFWNVQVDLVD